MSWLAGFFRELWGLFVEDGSYALAILAWVVVVYLLRHVLPAPWPGVLLFAGLAAVLFENIWRSRGR